MKKLFIFSLVCSVLNANLETEAPAIRSVEQNAQQEVDFFEQMILEQVKQFSPDMAQVQKAVIDKIMRYKLDTIKDILMVDKDDVQLVNAFMGNPSRSVEELRGAIIGLQYSTEQMEKVTDEVVGYFREKALARGWSKEVANDLTDNYYLVYFKNQVGLLKNKLAELKAELETTNKMKVQK